MKNAQHKRRDRIRNKISLISPYKKRLSVRKSNRHLYIQLFDPSTGRTMLTVSTLNKELNLGSKQNNSNKIQAEKLGSIVGKKASELGVDNVVFDRGGYKYHGVIKVLADEVRKYIKF